MTRTSGNRHYVNSAYANLGIIDTSGVDLNFNVALATWPTSDCRACRVGWARTSRSTSCIKYDAQDFPTQKPRENKGTLIDSGYFSYRGNMNVRYTLGAANVGLTWRYLPSVRSATFVTDPTTPIQGADSYSLFNLTAGYNIGSMIQLTGGIDNLFNKDPNIVGAGQVVDASGWHDCCARMVSGSARTRSSMTRSVAGTTCR